MGRLGRPICTQILPRPARKELNVSKLKSSWGLTVLINLLCPSSMQSIRSHYIYRTVGNLLRALDTGNWVVHYTRDFCIMGTKSASFGRQIHTRKHQLYFRHSRTNHIHYKDQRALGLNLVWHGKGIFITLSLIRFCRLIFFQKNPKLFWRWKLR